MWSVVPKSPINGPPKSPFSASPSQLQETLECSSSPSAGRVVPSSPGSGKGATPVRGRTMREYEEQLDQLQKSNFNLKLRIFYMDKYLAEHCGDEDLVKKNIQLQVELEALRRERDEAQDLLVKSAKLVEMTDKQYKTDIVQKDDKILELEQQVGQLEKELELCKHVREDRSEAQDSSAHMIELSCYKERIMELEESTRQFQETVKSLEAELELKHLEASELRKVVDEKSEEVNRLNSSLSERDTLLDEMASKVNSYEQEIRLLKDKLRSSSESSPRRHSSKLLVQQCLELEQKHKKLEDDHQKALCAIQGLMRRSKDQARELEATQAEMEEKDRRLKDLTSEIYRLRGTASAKMEKSQEQSRRREGDTAEGEIAGCESGDFIDVLESQVKDLMRTLNEKQCNLTDSSHHLAQKTARNSEYWKKRVEELEQAIHNTPERDGDSRVVAALRDEVSQARQEVARAEAWQLETSDKCAVLMKRLEELALFLKSLLLDGRLLCGLSDRRKILLKRIIEESLEISRNLSVSFSGTADMSLQVHSVTSSFSETQHESLLQSWNQEEEEFDVVAHLENELQKIKMDKQLGFAYKDSSLLSVNSRTFLEESRREKLYSGSDIEVSSDRSVKIASDNHVSLRQVAGDGSVEKMLCSDISKTVMDDFLSLYQFFSYWQQYVISSDSNTQGSDNKETCTPQFSVTARFPEEFAESMKIQRDRLEKYFKKSQTWLSHLEKAHSESDDGKLKLLEKLEKNEMLEQELQALKNRESALEKEVLVLKEHVSVKEQEIQDLCAQVKLQDQKYKECENDRFEVDKQLQILESDIKQCREENSRLEEAVVSLELKCATSQNENVKLQNNILLLEEKLEQSSEMKLLLENKLHSLDSKCRKVGEDKAQLESEVQLLRQKSDKLEVDKFSLYEELQMIEKKLIFAEQLNKILESKVQELREENKKVLEDYDTRREDLKRKLVEAEKLGSRISARMTLQVEKDKQIKEAESRLLEREREMEKKNDELNIEMSRLQMENARLENEKLYIERELHRMEERSAPRLRHASGGSLPEDVRNSLEYDLEDDVPAKDGSSKECRTTDLWVQLADREAVAAASMGVDRDSASPDLGIDSDNGRLSVAETVPHDCGRSCKSCSSLQKENSYLKQKQAQTQSLLEDMLSRLSSANHWKKEVSKAVLKEFCKTKRVLKATRSNLETALVPKQSSDV